MMFELIRPLPKRCLVAVSGGIDSMCALHWLRQGSKDRVQGIVHINHGTPHAKEAEWFVSRQCTLKDYNSISIHRITKEPHPNMSKEEYWRTIRYKYFEQVSKDYDLPIVLAHNLDDCVEEYVMSTMVRGFMGTIPYNHGPCIRPFRLWSRTSIEKYAERNKVLYIEDPSNKDTSYKRNHIRHNVLPELLKLNPGLYSYVSRLIKQEKI